MVAVASYRHAIIFEYMLDKVLINGRVYVPNGTGPTNNPFVTKLLKKLPSSKITDEAARFHDICYTIGGAEINKIEADNIYYELMKKCIKEECKWYTRGWFYIHAWRNWRFVVRLGDDSFNFTTEKPFTLEKAD